MIVLDWITHNLSTVLLALGLFCICFAIVRKMIRDKKQGKSSCGCGCSACAMKDMCHSQNGAKPMQIKNTQSKTDSEV